MNTDQSQPTILIVESTRFMLRILRRGLEKQDYSVTSAPDGESALRQVQANAPDILIVDTEIRPMSGEELCRRIDTQMPERTFFTCVLTSSAEHDHAGFGHFFSRFVLIEKPVSMRTLVKHIEQHLAEPAT